MLWPIGGMVNTSPSQGEDYQFDAGMGYHKESIGLIR